MALQSMSRQHDSANLKQRVFDECLSIYNRSLNYSISSALLSAVLLSYVVWSPEKARQLSIWFSLLVLIAAYRIFTTRRYRAQSPKERASASRRWYREMLVGAILSGLIWGAAAYLYFDQTAFIDSLAVAFVITGVSAGSVISLSAFLEAAVIFLMLTLLPLLLRLVQMGIPETYVMAAMVIVFLLFMVALARNVNKTVVTGLQMRFLRSRAEATVERQALFDELTGLPNRRLLQDRVAQALAHSQRSNRQAALLFLDLDFFKRVNDSLGHDAGDQLLVEVAHRMRALLRKQDTGARLGGDEFVALFTDIEGTRDEVVSLVQKRGDELRRAIEAPVNLRGNEVHVTVSIGVSLLPMDTDNVQDIMTHADTAMYRAKDDGRNTLRFFATEMQEDLARRVEIEKRLRLAIEQRYGLELYLQPQFNQALEICGAELLLRWTLDGESISPATFIPIAEDTGLIYRLGEWVIEEACRIADELRQDVGDREFSLAFNVSPRQFRQKDFTDRLLHWISHFGLPEGLIELELTERLLIDEVDDTIEKMRILREHGVRFSIDDFGTGYSSLRYLKTLPLDRLKIDESFVRDLLTDPNDASIVRAIISMADTLELEVVAEGVEKKATHDSLIRVGCTRFQGFLYARPMPSAEFSELLKAP